MGVQRYPDPRLVTDSMCSGGEPHVSYGMSAPGTPGVAPAPQPFEVLDLGGVPGASMPDVADRNPVEPSGAMAAGHDSPFPQAGSFGQESYNAGLWKKTPSS